MSEEVPIELYRKTNNEFVKYVRYDDYKKLENIIKEVREYIQDRYNGEVLTHTFDKDNVGELLNILKEVIKSE